MWDTETGDVVGRFTNNKMAFCVKFNPNDDKQHLIVAGTSSNKIICWDIRSGDIVQEYDRHLAAVTAAPNGKVVACQSLDNKIVIYQVGDRFKEMC